MLKVPSNPFQPLEKLGIVWIRPKRNARSTHCPIFSCLKYVWESLKKGQRARPPRAPSSWRHEALGSLQNVMKRPHIRPVPDMGPLPYREGRLASPVFPIKKRWVPPYLLKGIHQRLMNPHSILVNPHSFSLFIRKKPILIRCISIGSVIVCGRFISTVWWKYSLFLRFSPWRELRPRHFTGYPFGASRKKASTIFYNTAFQYIISACNLHGKASNSPFARPMRRRYLHLCGKAVP